MTDETLSSLGGAPDTEMLHATTVAIGDRAVLIVGRSGSGKSDLALRLIDRGAVLVSDDYTEVFRSGDEVYARPPETIAGRIEIRGVGVTEIAYITDIRVGLCVMLDEVVERMPMQYRSSTIAGIEVPIFAVDPFHASAAIKVEIALQRRADVDGG